MGHLEKCHQEKEYYDQYYASVALSEASNYKQKEHRQQDL